MRLPQIVDRTRSFSRCFLCGKRGPAVNASHQSQLSHIVTACPMCHSSAANAFTPTESHADLRRMVREFAV